MLASPAVELTCSFTSCWSAGSPAGVITTYDAHWPVPVADAQPPSGPAVSAPMKYCGDAWPAATDVGLAGNSDTGPSVTDVSSQQPWLASGRQAIDTDTALPVSLATRNRPAP